MLGASSPQRHRRVERGMIAVVAEPAASRPHMPGLWDPARRPGARAAAVVVGGQPPAHGARLLARHHVARRRRARHAGVGRVARRRAVVQLEPRVTQGAEPRARRPLRAHHRRRQEPRDRRGRRRARRRPRAPRRVQRHGEREVRHELHRRLLRPCDKRRWTVRPTWVFGLDGDDFTGSPTRWEFD